MTAPPILITSCLLILLLPLSVKAAGWEKLPPLPEPNGGFMPLISQNTLVIAGGTHWEGGSKNWLRTLHFLDTQNLSWTSGPKLKVPIAYGVRLSGGYVGGTDGQRPIKTLSAFDGGKLSTLPLDALPDSLVLSAGGQLKSGTLIIAGGTPDPANLATLTNAAYAVTADHHVEPLPDYPGKPFGTAAATTLGESLYIFAGANWNANTQAVVNTDEAHVFSMKTRSWKKLASFPYPVRGLSAVPLDESTLYLAGGYTGDAEGFTDQAFLYDLHKDEYRPAKPLPYKAMVGLVICDGYVYCLGGEDKQKSRTDACFRIPITELIQ
jgi:N-acetylneuraminic acid mutarotase